MDGVLGWLTASRGRADREETDKHLFGFAVGSVHHAAPGEAERFPGMWRKRSAAAFLSA
jgi:hypothetical protein